MMNAGLKSIDDIYLWTEKNQQYLTDRRPLARVAIIYSQQTSWYYGAKVEDYALGWYQALVESRIPFEMVHDHLLDPEHLAPFKTLILPNLAALSESQCDQLRAFVSNGGSIVATHETSLYDEVGNTPQELRSRRPLRRRLDGQSREGPMLNSYIRLEHGGCRGHALFGGLEEAPESSTASPRLEVTPRAAVRRDPLHPHPQLPRPAHGEGLPAGSAN